MLGGRQTNTVLVKLKQLLMKLKDTKKDKLTLNSRALLWFHPFFNKNTNTHKAKRT